MLTYHPKTLVLSNKHVLNHTPRSYCLKKYHQPLRTVYRELKRTQYIPKELPLATAVNAINDVAGPDALKPSLLVFGTYPNMSTPHENQLPKPNQEQRKSLL